MVPRFHRLQVHKCADQDSRQQDSPPLAIHLGAHLKFEVEMFVLVSIHLKQFLIVIPMQSEFPFDPILLLERLRI